MLLPPLAMATWLGSRSVAKVVYGLTSNMPPRGRCLQWRVKVGREGGEEHDLCFMLPSRRRRVGEQPSPEQVAMMMMMMMVVVKMMKTMMMMMMMVVMMMMKTMIMIIVVMGWWWW